MLFAESIIIGELGTENVVSIQDSITSLSFDLTSNMVSEVRFTVHDPNFKMYKNNYFMIGRQVRIKGQGDYEMARISITHASQDSVEVQARSKATEKMRRAKGAKSFGTISPSVFASNLAKEYGLKAFVEDSPATAIRRESSDGNEESTWDVLTRLASKQDFLVFESKGMLFFASRKFIAERQPRIFINIPSSETDPFFAQRVTVSKSQDAELVSNFQASLLKNVSTMSLYPGAVAVFSGVGDIEGIPFMIDRVSFTADLNTPVSVTGATVEDLEEISCSQRTFDIGARGRCVQRIQRAVGATVDGIYDQETKRAVREFQRENDLRPTGVVNRKTWAKIETVNVDVPRRRFKKITEPEPAPSPRNNFVPEVGFDLTKPISQDDIERYIALGKDQKDLAGALAISRRSSFTLEPPVERSAS